ncbi:MAG: helix-turn-helix transcriptional regulator [Lapillicoccus sp.]
MDDITDDGGLPHFVDRLNRFMAAYRWRDPIKLTFTGYDDHSLAARLTELGVPTSRSYVNQIRSGTRRNPSARLVLALSHALHVLPEAWFDEAAAAAAVRTMDAATEALRQDE